jgi:hypothetical protein
MTIKRKSRHFRRAWLTANPKEKTNKIKAGSSKARRNAIGPALHVPEMFRTRALASFGDLGKPVGNWRAKGYLVGFWQFWRKAIGPGPDRLSRTWQFTFRPPGTRYWRHRDIHHYETSFLWQQKPHTFAHWIQLKWPCFGL